MIKLKPKQLLKTLLTAAVTLTAALSISVTALADDFWGNNLGSTAQLGSAATYMYETNEINSWKVSLYVATTDDGKIDPATANIATSNGLARVGTIIYNNEYMSSSDAVFFPIETTDNLRYTAAAKFAATGSSAVKFPMVTQVQSNHRQLKTSSSGDPIYHNTDCPLELPYAGAYNNNANGKPKFTQTIIEDMNIALGGTPGDLTKLYTAILPKLGIEPKQKLVSSGYDFTQLVPTNDDCVVEWCCVIEPMIDIHVNLGTSIYGFFTERLDFFGSWYTYHMAPAYCAAGGTVRLCLDSYSLAAYNQASKTYYSYDSNIKGISDIITDFSSYPRLNSWKSIGPLVTELGSKFMNNTCPTLVNVYQPELYYCGVPSYQAYKLSFDIANNPGYYAAYGGIGVLLTELDEGGIPVYYHIGKPDPDNPSETNWEVITRTWNPDPDNPKPFVPDTDLGEPKAIGSSHDPTPFTNPDSPYPSGLDPEDVDPPFEIEIPPDDPPAEIHIEIIEKVGPPVYYHKYTVTITDADLANKSLAESDKLELINAHASELKATAVYTDKADEESFKPSTSYGIPVADFLAYGTNKPADPKQLEYPKTNHNTAVDKYGEPTSPFRSIASESFKWKAPDKTPSQIHVMTVELIIKEPPPATIDEYDRIKSWDVTQLINQTKPGVEGSEHLNVLTSYEHPDEQGTSGPYNNYFSSSVNKSGTANDKTHIAVITSVDKHATGGNHEQPHKGVRAKNGIQAFPEIGCSLTVTHAPKLVCSTPLTTTDSDGNTISTGHSHTSGCYCTGKSKNYSYYGCVFTREYTHVAFGLFPTYEQITEDNAGRVKYLINHEANISKHYNDVGLTLPKIYYDKADVVKASLITDLYKPNTVFLLPKDNPNKADIHAVFDVLLGKDGDSDKYWIRYYNNLTEIDYQTRHADNNDKEADKTATNGGLGWNFTSGDKQIDGVKFIAHRDLLAGDDLSTSLAVSGYMAKYASKSNTSNYLNFMKAAGFKFKGIQDLSGEPNLWKYTGDIQTIGHDNRIVWISNSTLSNNELNASSNGRSDTYNSDYSKGSNDEYSVRFGLGGQALHTMDLNEWLRSNSPNVENSSLEENKDGDVLRSTYYYATYDLSREDVTPGFDKYNVEKHILSCHGNTKECGGHGVTHANSGCLELIHNISSVSADIYVTKNRDKYLPNGKIHGSVQVYQETQDKMYESIDLSRTTFRVDLPVEGTTAGQYTSKNEVGLKWTPTDVNGNTIDGLSIGVGTVEGYPSAITLEYGNNDDLKNAWRQNTFEMVKSNYQTVGSAKSIEKDNVLAEYRITTPTVNYVFNPSYYMLYDDGFEQDKQNKSVWMLSEQARVTNFKDILDIRLTYDNTPTTPDTISKSDVYPTEVSSDWSTDKADRTTQSDANLPVTKAGDSYSTQTDTVSGTVTAYVVLQDPEFTGDPAKARSENERKLSTFSKQMAEILGQFNAASKLNGYELSTENNHNKLSLAMYTNMVNGSSINSAFRVEGTGTDTLADKEPMILSSNTRITHEVSTGTDKNPTDVKNENWTFYALSGYEVKPFKEGKEDQKTDLSDTTTAGRRTFAGQTIRNMSKATAYQQEVLAELNDHLCALMVEPHDKKDSLAVPENTHPYKNDERDFTWYSEDYEGIIVAVFEIDFIIDGANDDYDHILDKIKDSITTDYRSIYRAESDWRSDINSLAAKDGHTLTVYTKDSFNNSNIDNFTSYQLKTRLEGLKERDAVYLDNKGTQLLITKPGENFIKDHKLNGIYGIGLELANLKIEFGTEHKLGDTFIKIIGDGNFTSSFFYQPTYYNIRGSVFDTSR